MRRILVEYARARRTEKRGGATTFVQLEDAADAGNRRNIADVLAVDEALEKLARLDPEQARVMELRFFAGLTVEEVAHVLSRSPRTVKREWRLARRGCTGSCAVRRRSRKGAVECGVAGMAGGNRLGLTPIRGELVPTSFASRSWSGRGAT